MKVPVPLIAAAVIVGTVVFIGRQLPKTSYASKIPQATKCSRGPKGTPAARQAAEQAAQAQAQAAQAASEA